MRLKKYTLLLFLSLFVQFLVFSQKDQNKLSVKMNIELAENSHKQMLILNIENTSNKTLLLQDHASELNRVVLISKSGKEYTCFATCGAMAKEIKLNPGEKITWEAKGNVISHKRMLELKEGPGGIKAFWQVFDKSTKKEPKNPFSTDFSDYYEEYRSNIISID